MSHSSDAVMYSNNSNLRDILVLPKSLPQMSRGNPRKGWESEEGCVEGRRRGFGVGRGLSWAGTLPYVVNLSSKHYNTQLCTNPPPLSLQAIIIFMG